ncbi:DNA repair protein RecO [Patescibacteria group bacterium]|nr:DNA repair protein RecO [Patescibacteria group bacterium]
MSTFKTEAIVLAKRPFVEDDRFYTIYTKDYGKLEVLVKAAAKSSSKLAGHLEPFSHARVMIVRGKSNETLAGTKLISFFHFSELNSLALANLSAEVLGKITKPGLANERIFWILLKLLPFLAGSSSLELKRIAVLRFIWQLLEASGYGVSDNNSSVFEKLPLLSAAANQLLIKQLLKKQNPDNFKTSVSSLKEVEDYTVNFLNYILESELKSLKIFSYA